MDRNEIDRLAKIILDHKNYDTSNATYKDSPYLKQLERMLDMGVFEDSSKENLFYIYGGYIFLADQYESMGRMAHVVRCYEKALNLAVKMKELHGYQVHDDYYIVSNLIKFRNYYIDDDCDDLRPLLNRLISQDETERYINDIKKRRRGLNHDPIEMSEEYLTIIDEVEEKLEKECPEKGPASCYKYWDLKEQYLLERGIKWSSPHKLNPKFHFD